MTLRYLSVCSGIEAATVAWHPLGWKAVAYSEIDKFPSAVLAHHYPETPNWGDMERFNEWPDIASLDVLVGGTPCQSFSVAGLREGLADPRGNLALVYLAIAARYRPRWVVWENVPGVLSSDDGQALGAFLGGLGELGYGFAYRVLDAQYFGVAQRRRRVFVVGHLGDWRRAAAVLLESASLRGDPPPRRTSRERIAGTLTRGIGERGAEGAERDLLVGGGVAHALRADGFDASEDGTGCGTPLVPELANPLTARMGKGINTTADEGQTAIPIAFSCKDSGHDAGALSPTLRALAEVDGNPNGGGQVAIAYRKARRAQSAEDDESWVEGEVANTVNCFDQGDVRATEVVLQPTMAVRRLMPRECERLQGFVDDYTLIPYNGAPAKDGPRYKALGNSMAVPVMRWIGERITALEA